MRIAEIELNSCTDNPLFFGRFQRGSFVGGGPGEGGDEGGGKLFEIGIEDLPSALTRKTLDTTHCSAANFHGEPVAIALDLLKIGVSELASIAERRIQLLLDANHNRGLPANLTLGAQGLHSGFQLMQYTAAALVAENRVLCHPSSVDSIPTSANAEDHVSMSANAARHAGEVLQNVTHVLAIETICALQALDIRTRFMGPLVRQRIRLRERRRGQGTGGQRTASIDDMRKVGWYIKREYGQIAMILFPEWARWRASQKHPVLEGEIKPGYEIQESDIPRRGYDWLNTEELTLTGPTRAVWELLRDESGYAIPVIHHDGVLGEKEKIWGLNDTVARSFQEFPPSDLIERTARAIISGDLKNAAWSALPAD